MRDDQPDIADILSEAVEIASPAAREAFVGQACRGDAQLKSRVDELIRMHFLAGDFLERPATDIPGTMFGSRAAVRVGSRIGPYKLLQEIGEGGMGAVYMAEQLEPVKRLVALKVIKLGMDTRQVIARFEAERQALAMMDHPNIAKVFDAGMTETGRPYFVMELIHGVPITRYCDEQHLTPIDRLRLFLPVCQAVQHAHQKGIIHRDLKPSNVLVAEYDDLAIPKVIDFGVAKATNQQLTDRTLFTEFGQVMGTFEYMSPEQAKRNQLDVDTRTDVYSLGVILYELLTGATPFDTSRFQQAAIDEILKMIGDEDPPRPSLRLSGSQSLPSIAANRRLEPARLSRFVEGDLDWIVMRSLEKDRARRYATVGSLAADVQRFLDDEPIEARPPSTVYRFRKFARRNTGVFVSVSLMAMLLLLGTVISTWLAVRAIRAERRAEALAALATRSAEEAGDARDLAEAERFIAVRREQSARQSRYSAHLLMARDAVARNDPVTAVERLNQEMPNPRNPDSRSFGWYYLRAQCGRELATFRSNLGTVWGVAYSPDGALLATAEEDATVFLWDVASRSAVRLLRGHEAPVSTVAFSPDRRLLASVSDDATIRLWDPATGAALGVIRGHDGNVRAVAFTPDGTTLATAGTDATIRFWNVADRQPIGELDGHSAEINQLAFSPDGTRLASCADDETVRVWNVDTHAQIAILSGHSGHVRSVVYSPDGTLIASGGRDAKIKLWSAETNADLAELQGHTAGIYCVAFSPDGAVLASVSEDRSLKFWDVATRQLLDSRIGHSARIYTVAYAPDGRSLASGGIDGTVKLWEAPDPARSILRGHLEKACSVAFSPDGQLLASAGWGDLIKLWDPATGREVRTLTGHKFNVTSVIFAPDGQTLASADGRGAIRLWNVETGELRAELVAHKSAVNQLMYSADGSLLASCGYDDTVKIWQMPDGVLLSTLTGHESGVYSIAFFPGGKMLASAGRDQTVRLWDIESQRSLAVLEGTGGIVRSVAVSPDGQVVASGGADGFIRLWDPATSRLLASFRGHARQIESLAFSTDGGFLASGSDDRTAKLWDLATGLEVANFTGHTGPIAGIALSHDGKQLATASGDSTVRLWDIQTADGWDGRARFHIKLDSSDDH